MKRRRLPLKDRKERTAFGGAILKHWRGPCPQRGRDLEQKHRLAQAVFERQEKTGDLLYELVSVKNMDYQAAWEPAREEWALLQGENKSEKESADLPPATPPSSAKSKSRSATSHRSRPRGRRRGTSG